MPFLRALQVCERKGLLFHELLSKLRHIREEYGPGAEWWEMALQAAIWDEDAAAQAEQVHEIEQAGDAKA